MTWQLFAAAAAALTANSAAVPIAAQDLSEAEIIQLEAERHRRMTIPVTIGDAGPFRFLIDTGAQATVLSRDLADRLALFDRASATLVGMASREPVETAAIPDFGIGSRRFYIQTAPLVDAAYIGDADGIVGLDSLQNQRVLLDFVRKEITVADSADLGGNRGYEIVVKARRRLGQLIITQARLDGVPVAVIVDSGASGSIGNPALLERLRGTRHRGQTSLVDINGATLAGKVRLGDELTVGRISLRNVPILFADSPPFHALGLSDEPALILGMSELKLFRRVAIDFKTQRILFDLPREVRPLDSSFGLRLGV